MTLSMRLSIIVLTVGLTITALNLMIVRQEITRQQISAQQVFAETLVQTMADAVALDVINRDDVKLTRILQSVRGYDKNPIEYLYVTDMEGHLFAHSYSSGFPLFLNQSITKHSSPSNGSEPIRLTAKYNIEHRGVIYEYAVALIPGLSAQLHLGLNQTEIQGLVNAASQQVFVIGVVLSLLCTWLAWLAARHAVRPIEQMSLKLGQYQSGANVDFSCGKFDALDIQSLKRSLQDVFNSRDYYERSLKAREQDLDVTLSSIGDAVLTTDKNGYVTRMNPVAEALTGWTIDDAKGQSVKTILPIINASTREPIANPVEKVLATGETVYLSNHTTLISKDGTEYQIADSAAPIRDENNAILGMVLVFNDVTEQYELRQAALQAQQLMQKTFNDMQTMVAVLDADLRVIFVNNTPLKISGLQSTDVEGEKLWACAWFNYDPALQAAIEKDCLKGLNGQSSRRDIQIMTENGLIWIDFGLHPIFGEDGKLVQLVAEGVNVSERKQLEEEMYASMQHLKLYREQTPLASIEWSTDFQVVNWNDAAEKMFGYSLDEVKGRSFTDVMLPDSAVADVKQIWQDLMAQTGGTVSTNENLTKQGGVILCEWYNSAIIDESGKVIGAASLVRDITHEHAAQQALEKTEQEQREMLNTLNDGVITIDDAGIMQTFNRAAEHLFGLSGAEAIGQNVSVLMPEPDKGQHDGYLARYIQSGRKQPLAGSREVLGRHKNNKTFPMRLTVAELPPSAEGKHRFIGSCQDLTQIKSQQAQIQRTQKMDALGKLVGGIAHDYNNMLGVILGYTSLMEMKFSDVDGLQKYIANINQAGERARRLTKRMLAFSKQESTQGETINVNSILADQKELFSKSLTAMITVNYQLCEPPWLIWVDKSELEDALLNLIINAKHAMNDGGELTLSTNLEHLSYIEANGLGVTENDYLRLSITDTGCGIDKEILESIFDPFFSTKGTEGTGLGLSQVYGFVERAGGTIKAYSQKGRGSEFSLYFPRYRGVEQRDTNTNEAASYRQGDGQTILVVDDEPALRGLAQEMLTIAGYHVLTANDGKHAIEVLTENKVDVVLSDVIMPKVDGYQLAKYIQENRPTIKIQLASGFSDNRHLAMENNFLHDTMLHKPYSSSELLSRIGNLIYGDKND
jgi:two-component system, cell cycle sensor histidine kinase and response regulator CckA